MNLTGNRRQRTCGVLAVALGLAAVTAAILVTPTFAARYLSSDHNLTPGGVKQLGGYRLVISITGVLSVMLGLVLVTVGAFGEKLHRIDECLARMLSSRMLKGALLLPVLCFSLLRFVHLNADPPRGISKSADLFTDEGWYSAAAVRHVLTRQWYLAEDVNTAVGAPVGQILHRVSFALFGLSLSSARMTVVVSFLLITLLSALLVRRRYGDYAALLTVLLLSTNYIGFSYSRLAFMYLVATFFVVASLLVAGGLDGKSGLPRLLGASLLLGVGILTNAVAVLGVPLLAFLAWRSGASPRERAVFLITPGLALAALVGGYVLVVRRAFPEDYALFAGYANAVMYASVLDWLRGLPGTVMQVRVLGADLVGVTILSAVVALFASERFRRDPLVRMFAGYLVVYAFMLSLNSYRPVRYYLPLLVPLAALCATACIALVGRLRETRWSSAAVVPIVLMLAMAAGSGRRIVTYLSRPSYSFYRMAHAVGGIIQEREGSVRGVTLFGDIASSVSLEIGTNAVNSLLGLEQFAQIRKYRPEYMIVNTSDIAQKAAAAGGVVTELGYWEVFKNYNLYANGGQVRLFYVDWQPRGPGNPVPPQRPTGGVGL